MEESNLQRQSGIKRPRPEWSSTSSIGNNGDDNNDHHHQEEKEKESLSTTLT